MIKKKNFLCFDLGGTYIKYGIVNNNGDILFIKKKKTPLKGNAIEICNFIKYIIDYYHNYNIVGVGIAAHGIVDVNNCMIIDSSEEMDGLVNYPLVKNILLYKKNLIVKIDNDVNASAIGELNFGLYKKKYNNFIYITLGTGVGGALIINNQLYRGCNYGAGEIGYIITNNHSCYNSDNKLCFWESYASSSSLMNVYKKHNVNIDSSDIHNLFINNLHLGCHKENLLFDNYLNYVCDGLVSLSHILSPEAIFIGGAISTMGNIFFDPLYDKFQNKLLNHFKFIKIHQASYPESSALLGMMISMINVDDNNKSI